MPKTVPPESPSPGAARKPTRGAKDNASPTREPATKITPVDRKIGEGPDNLRDREDAFDRRRGAKR